MKDLQKSKQVLQNLLNMQEEFKSTKDELAGYKRFMNDHPRDHLLISVRFHYQTPTGGTGSSSSDIMTSAISDFIEKYFDEMQDEIIKAYNQKIAQLSRETKKAMLTSLGMYDDEPQEGGQE